MSQLSVAELGKRFGKKVALDSISLEVAEGEFLCLLGPTNAGKSTLLKLVAGLHRPDSGRIFVAGRDVTDVDPADRGVSLLFQNIALFPDRDGFENIAFPLRRARLPAPEIRRRVLEVAELLRITHLLERYPRTYSGGELQRVAIGRAVARPSELLLLDEPLSNLDARIRLELRLEFRRLHRSLGQTVVYVTHDQTEALSLADRVAVLKEGRIQQIADPDTIYDRPANRFVAEFIGTPPMNLIPVNLDYGEEGRPLIAGRGFRFDLPDNVGFDDLPRDLQIGVRPEALRVAPNSGAETPFPAFVRWAEHHGACVVLGIEFAGVIVKALISPDHPVNGKGPAWIGFASGVEHLLDAGRDVFLATKRT